MEPEKIDECRMLLESIRGELKLMRAETTEGSGIPGSVLLSDPKAGLVIACGSGAVRILELQAPGGKKMRSQDYLRGHDIPVGTTFVG